MVVVAIAAAFALKQLYRLFGALAAVANMRGAVFPRQLQDTLRNDLDINRGGGATSKRLGVVVAVAAAATEAFEDPISCSFLWGLRGSRLRDCAGSPHERGSVSFALLLHQPPILRRHSCTFVRCFAGPPSNYL